MVGQRYGLGKLYYFAVVDCEDMSYLKAGRSAWKHTVWKNVTSNPSK